MASTRASRETKQGFWVALGAFISLVHALVVRDLRTEHKNAALAS